MSRSLDTYHAVNAPETVASQQFPVGYYDIHPNVSLNFQMNRWYSWTNDQEMLAEMRAGAQQIHNYADVYRIYSDLSEKALQQNHVVRAAFYLRMAEFFLFADDPAKLPARNRFVKLLTDHFEIPASARHLIPYKDSNLVAYRFTPEQPKGTIVAFGGFDSYIEEFFPILFRFRDAGYDIVCFEGPGQGAALEDFHLPMTPEWEYPVKAVLDYFGLEDATLIGISLGGYLALRAAAYEPRIQRVVAWDIMTDAFEGALGLMSPAIRNTLKMLVRSGAAGLVNLLARHAMRSSLVVEWGLKQAMHVMGGSTPYEALRQISRYHTREFSAQVHQDVLLLAGQEDHYVPVRLFYEQIEILTHARSLAARLFTRDEQAQNHCQVGNIGLAIKVIMNWIDLMTP